MPNFLQVPNSSCQMPYRYVRRESIINSLVTLRTFFTYSIKSDLLISLTFHLQLPTTANRVWVISQAIHVMGFPRAVHYRVQICTNAHFIQVAVATATTISYKKNVQKRCPIKELGGGFSSLASAESYSTYSGGGGDAHNRVRTGRSVPALTNHQQP